MSGTGTEEYKRQGISWSKPIALAIFIFIADLVILGDQSFTLALFG